MKKGLLISLGFALFLQSCKEQIPNGLNLNSLISKDTTYVTSVFETPQQKKVLIEELTGASCTNCPAGTKQLREFDSLNPGRIVITALHSGFLTEPPAGALYDFRNPDADALKLFFNEGDPGKPSATFDRIPATSGTSAGKYFILRGQTGTDWTTTLPALLAKTTPVNIHLESAYNGTTGNVEVKIKLAFTADVTDQLAVSLFVLENGRVDIQEDKDLGEIEDYHFSHIFRKLITPTSGELILDSLSTKVKGRVLEKTLVFQPSTSGINGWNLDSCMIVGAVHRTGTSKEVLHVEEVKLK